MFSNSSLNGWNGLLSFTLKPLQSKETFLPLFTLFHNRGNYHSSDNDKRHNLKCIYKPGWYSKGRWYMWPIITPWSLLDFSVYIFSLIPIVTRWSINYFYDLWPMVSLRAGQSYRYGLWSSKSETNWLLWEWDLQPQTH